MHGCVGTEEVRLLLSLPKKLNYKYFCPLAGNARGKLGGDSLCANHKSPEIIRRLWSMFSGANPTRNTNLSCHLSSAKVWALTSQILCFFKEHLACLVGATTILSSEFNNSASMRLANMVPSGKSQPHLLLGLNQGSHTESHMFRFHVR